MSIAAWREILAFFDAEGIWRAHKQTKNTLCGRQNAGRTLDMKWLMC